MIEEQKLSEQLRQLAQYYYNRQCSLTDYRQQRRAILELIDKRYNPNF